MAKNASDSTLPTGERDPWDAGRWPAPKVVFPLYVMSRVRRGIEADIETPVGLLDTMGEIESLGNSRYRLRVTDVDLNRYLITVEVEEPPEPADGNPEPRR